MTDNAIRNAPSGDMRPLSMVYEDQNLRITHSGGEGPRLVVSCSGIAAPGADCPNEEFVDIASSAGRRPALFVMDKTNSWLNTSGLLECIVENVEAVSRRCGAQEVCTLGNSMGGFMAMMLPAFTRVRSVVAFAPQYSVDPALNPAETRWRDLIDGIAEFRWPSLTGHLRDDVAYTVAHGGHHREQAQLAGFPRAASVTHFVNPLRAHGVARAMKEAGVLQHIVNCAFDGRRQRVRQLMKQAGFRTRRGEQPVDVNPGA